MLFRLISLLIIVLVLFDFYYTVNTRRRNKKQFKFKRQSYTALEKQREKIISRLEKTDPLMFDHFAEYQLNFHDVFNRLTVSGRKQDFELIKYTERALDRLESTQEKVREIARHLRDHKFNEVDWRNVTEETDMNHLVSLSDVKQQQKYNDLWYLLYRFPDPPLSEKAEDAFLAQSCKESIIECIDLAHETFKKSNSVSETISKQSIIPEDQKEEVTANEKILMTIMPFTTHKLRFRYRTTAAYYLCSYAIKKAVELRKFGDKCDENIDEEYTFYRNQTSDQDPYACALLSFCPDVCYGRVFRRRKNEERFKEDSANPCKGIADGSCELSMVDNNNYEDLKRNNINVSCNCLEGSKFITKLGVCVDIDECDVPAHNCYEPGQTCLNTVFGFKCTCVRGFQLKEYEVNFTHFENYTERTTLEKRSKCVNFNELSDLEVKIEEENKNYNRDIVIDMFKLVHQNKTV